jgi:hypothetical protein
MPTNAERIANLELEIAELKARDTPQTPAPERLPKPPAWAGPQGNFGMAYCGEPSTPQTGDGQVWIKVDPKTGHRRFPDGISRDDSGNVVPHPIAGVAATKPAGPERSPQLQQNIELLDAGLARR